MQKYKHLFFDLDRTLWDFEKNSIEAFRIIFHKRSLSKFFPDFDQFITTYKMHNEKLWDLYKLGQIKKEELRDRRFLLTLNDFGNNDEALAHEIGDDYIELSPLQTILFPGTIETLEYLRPKYQMYIITNGFVEVQYKKLKNCGLDMYFDRVITSEAAKASKPKPEIFHFALSSANAKKIESLMIGDDLENDILGAKRYGFDQVFFNPDKKSHQENVTFEIESINDLQNIL
ncbi:MAG: YjjG family noncanonical pyrimidine nucleotidase [Bacteroidales bacterium]|nr:YjjG family noncanonical pyrimidine nucleotidase [Bacteroidales bacterium]